MPTMIRRRSATRMARPARKSIQFDTDRAPEKSLAEISAGTIVAEPAAPMPELRRFAADADVDTLALTLIGAGHLLFAGREGTRPEAGAVGKVVTTVIAGHLHEPPDGSAARG